MTSFATRRRWSGYRARWDRCCERPKETRHRKGCGTSHPALERGRCHCASCAHPPVCARQPAPIVRTRTRRPRPPPPSALTPRLRPPARAHRPRPHPLPVPAVARAAVRSAAERRRLGAIETSRSLRNDQRLGDLGNSSRRRRRKAECARAARGCAARVWLAERRSRLAEHQGTYGKAVRAPVFGERVIVRNRRWRIAESHGHFRAADTLDELLALRQVLRITRLRQREFVSRSEHRARQGSTLPS